MDCSRPGFPVHHQLLELAQLMSINLLMPSNHLILCRPLLLLPSIFPSNKIFSNDAVLCIRWPKYWSFNLASVLPMKTQGCFSLGITGLISLESRELKSLLQHHSSKASVLQRSAFFIVQLSYPHVTTGKNRFD